MASSSSSSSQSDPNVFSLRIVTLDYYMSPPIQGLDFSYSSFQGRNVEEIPVIRIFGSTPVGQKACLHIHQALPYLYIPCPDGALKCPEEGHKFMHILSNAIEKALKRKGGSATKRRHVHECRLVRAKKLYGYHASDDLFVKIYLYYPHEVAYTATMLLEGAILNTSFQPYESHIPYLLHFLIDYNLYGMGHVHLSKFKFRSPIPDACNPGVACFQKHGMKVHGNSSFWLSSTVPSEFTWCSATGSGLQDKLITRQSTCSLEVDASANDILNESYKMFTSLSQTRSEVKMVQSLVPIWEEEYERSGTPDVIQSPDAKKPTPENVLRSLNDGLDYNRVLGELCAEIDKTFSFGVFGTEGDGKIENSIKSFTSTGKALAILEPSSSCNLSREPLESLREENKNISLPGTFLLQEKKDNALYEKMRQVDALKSTSDKIISEVSRSIVHESVDTEALGLLSWLASSQAAEDVSTDDELVREAILSPLLSAKSYKEALEMAHLDYENASQQECLDILDSLEGLHGTMDQDITTVSLSSGGNVIPQVDGSVDDDFRTPQKGGLSETNMTGESNKYSAHQIAGCNGTSLVSKRKKSKLLWGPLPFACEQKQQEYSKPAVFSSCHYEEMKSDSVSSLSAVSKGDRCGSALETYNEKGEKLAPLNSVRYLMRRKRQLRTEQSDIMMRNKETMVLFPKELIHHKSEMKAFNIMPTQNPNAESSSAVQDCIDWKTVTHTTTCTQDACTKDRSLQIDYCSSINRNSMVSLFNDQVIPSKMPLESTSESQRFALTDLSYPQVVPIKFNELGHCRNIGTASCSNTSGGHEILLPDSSQGIMRTCSTKLSAPSRISTSLVAGNPNVDEGLDFHKCENQCVVEPLAENRDTCTRNLSTAHVEQILMHDMRDYKSNQDKEAQENFLQAHPNTYLESDSPLNNNVQDNKDYVRESWMHSGNNKDYVRGDSRHGSVNPDLKRDTSDVVEMSFSRKPPSIQELDECSEDSPGTSTHARNRAEINGDFLHFFSSNFEDGNSSKLPSDENLIFHQESTLGVPTHFQNDGSVLYLLTHVTLPPSVESVNQWLLEVVERNCWNVCAGDGCEKHLEGTGAVQPDQSNQEGITDIEAGSHGSRANTMLNELQEADLYTKNNALKIDSQDLSQISGPDREDKSGLTPISQIGFRETASVGGGQQLTLISIEMQAESRGDMLPDPKMNAINVISLAIQEDSSHTVEVHVLMRGNSEELRGRSVDGISNCKFHMFDDEKHLLDHFVKLISSVDPDVLMGWEIQGGSLGFLAERAAHLGISLLKKISRTATYETKSSNSVNPELSKVHDDAFVADTVSDHSKLEDEWGHTHASGIHVTGRIVLNIWWLMRAELKLHMYNVEAVAEDTLRRKIPFISNRVLNNWYWSGRGVARYRCIQYVTERCKLNLEIMNQLDMINRTSELARVFGIDFFSVLSRGSQFRVESMLLRLAHTQNFLAISPGNNQVASQPAMECLPLVMEPESGFYADPVVVLDFQSLYPSMIIAYNLCYSTCLGTVVSSKTNILGVTTYLPDPLLLRDLRQQLLLTPNGIMYVPSKVRRGVLPHLLEEILSTRIMVKQAMKKLLPSQQVLQRIFNARQLALKLIANVTYGYTAAGFSGRMPCAELADSIVQCGRRTLETAISFVNQHDKWNAKVVYGDTDSMFVLLKGRSREEAFRIGSEIASAVTAMNPYPVTLKMEKVYNPCFLLTKKRYVGYSYETPDQEKPKFDAKGIETVRRDTCPAVAKTLERSIRLIFEHQDILLVKSYLQRQWKRVISGKVSLQDFIFAKEVRLGTYSTRASSLPPAAIVAVKAMQTDPRAGPRYGERIPYVVINGEPGARLVDMVVNPYVLLDINSPYGLNELYYIKKQMIPALQRVFGLVGADLNQWFLELPRPVRPTLAKRHSNVSHSGSFCESDSNIRSETSRKVHSKRSRIDTYYISKHCTLCGELAQASAFLCGRCSKKESLVTAVVVCKASRLEKEIQHLAAICRHCGGGDWILESGVKCTSLACPVFYERRKVQKELQAISSFATEAGFYPMCMAELF